MNRTARPSGYHGGYLAGFVLIAVAALRIALLYGPNPLAPILLLALYAVLYSLEPWLSGRLERQWLLYFPVQSAIMITLSNLRPFLDVLSTLYIPLAIQVVRAFPIAAPGKSRRTAAAWLSFHAFLMGITLLLGMGWAEGLALLLLNLAFAAFVISFDLLHLRTQADRAESQRLLADLQSAHRQLQEYAGQAEELAAARERNRLARELHDSISQAIFSIRLTSQSARILLDREPARAPELVDLLQAMTGDALAQLRALIAQLRPPLDS